jgi:hypothetical protein
MEAVPKFDSYVWWPHSPVPSQWHRMHSDFGILCNCTGTKMRTMRSTAIPWEDILVMKCRESTQNPTFNLRYTYTYVNFYLFYQKVITLTDTFAVTFYYCTTTTFGLRTLRSNTLLSKQFYSRFRKNERYTTRWMTDSEFSNKTSAHFSYLYWRNLNILRLRFTHYIIKNKFNAVEIKRIAQRWVNALVKNPHLSLILWEVLKSCNYRPRRY